MFKKYFIIFSLVISSLIVGQFVFARNPEDITDWYIKDFQTEITVNKDSSLNITENIIADCGNLPDKHGIFRVLPLKINTDKGSYNTPIELISITDFNGRPYNFKIINNILNHTITWKIGSPNATVSGVNYYKIVYKVENAIRFQNPNFDELYWNLLGNFWDIETDNFSAKIYFPQEINNSNTQIDYYTGVLGSKSKDLATYFWDNNVLNFISKPNYTFMPGEGVTVSASFPKNIFTPYVPTFIEKYINIFGYFSFLIPILIFVFAFLKWKKYGKDPKMKKPIPPEFGIPEDITPIQMGMVLSHGIWKDKFITSAIISFAVRKIIIIEQTEKKILFFNNKDVVLRKVQENYDLSKVTDTEKILLEGLFDEDDGVALSSLRYKFNKELLAIKKSALDDSVSNGWLAPKSNAYMWGFIIAGITLVFLSIFSIILSSLLVLNLFISAIILILFGIFMPKRTQAGVDLLFKIKGFELYMKQAEDYRQQFYEKESIFDKFLPYAIVFGIAELWAKKMQLIYGEDYFTNYHPVWMAGSVSVNFDVSSFTSQLNSITSSISSSTSSSSGAGGSGGSGGGGGGGGGGGW